MEDLAQTTDNFVSEYYFKQNKNNNNDNEQIINYN